MDETKNETASPENGATAQEVANQKLAVDLSVLDAATPTEASPHSQWNPEITDIVKRNQAESPPAPRKSVLNKQRPNVHEPAGGGTVDVELCDGSTLRCIGEIIPPP